MPSYQGSCHCGSVTFVVECPTEVTVEDCNCSICAKSGFLHLIVPQARFKLTKGEANLTTYRFNTGVAQHRFCATCGVKPFYVPRSNPDGVSVNYRCLGEHKPTAHIEAFDGQNWEQNAHLLQGKTKG